MLRCDRPRLSKCILCSKVQKASFWPPRDPTLLLPKPTQTSLCYFMEVFNRNTAHGLTGEVTLALTDEVVEA